MACFKEILFLNANSVDPDQTQYSAASDLGLHFLLMSLLKDARHTWVKGEKILSLEIAPNQKGAKLFELFPLEEYLSPVYTQK